MALKFVCVLLLVGMVYGLPQDYSYNQGRSVPGTEFSGLSSQGFDHNRAPRYDKEHGSGNQAFGPGNQGYGHGNQGFGQGNQGFGQGNQGYGPGNQGFGSGGQGPSHRKGYQEMGY
ncbi:unnamed protein product [Leptosia nina]|uniref:Uncharacterized protein n=1 Tax=Leptosia nina TaxID=320188 RepID=A0AAV1JQV1_9NEOP